MVMNGWISWCGVGVMIDSWGRVGSQASLYAGAAMSVSNAKECHCLSIH